MPFMMSIRHPCFERRFMLIHILPIILDINECTDNPCHHNATCNNTKGGHTCHCKNGFNGNGTHCSGKYLILFILSSNTTSIR